MKVMMGMSLQTADLEQLASLALDAAGRVDHHDGRVDRAQGAVGVLAEVGWPGVSSRLKTIPLRSKVMTELVTEMPRACSIAIQSDRVCAALAACLDRAGQLDGAAEQQQLLGERRLAGVRVRDDRERAPPLDLGEARGWAGLCCGHVLHRGS
jgi:hypothetical protein